MKRNAHNYSKLLIFANNIVVENNLILSFKNNFEI